MCQRKSSSLKFWNSNANTKSMQFSMWTGRKNESTVGCARIVPSVKRVIRINSTTTILTAELYGLLLAVDYITKKRFSRSLVYTDTTSSLKAVILLKRVTKAIVSELQTNICLAANSEIHIDLCWVPTHVGIPGHEVADSPSTSANERQVDLHEIPYKDYHKYLKQCI